MNPEACKYLPLVREALKNENYKAADSLIRNIQGKSLGILCLPWDRYILISKRKTNNYYRELSLDDASPE
ncbi:MAG: hypothetical protein IPH28_23185 [Cytophagaceae bacterium]|nr:hypothetical protein [Cytophagaceae bacterium]